MQTTRCLIERLMACQPVSADLAAVNRATELLRAYLADEHGLFTAVEALDGRHILYAATQVGRCPDVLLNSHLDVVPAEVSLFTPREEDGWLYGRGTDDCLGNSAVVAQALIRLKGRASVGAVFSTDEEVGGATTAAMVARGYGARRLVLVLDGGRYALITAQKGILTVQLRATGVSCHAAEPWLGQNAIDRLIDGYLRLRPLFPAVAPPDEWRNTMVAAQCQAGTVSNRVPDAAEMVLNIRYTETTDADVLLQHLAAVSGLEVTCRVRCSPVCLSEDTPVLKELLEHMRRTLEHPISLKRLNGATDARHFVSLGIPIGILGIPGKGPHASDEAIELAGLRAYEEMLVTFLAPGVA